MGKKNIKGVWIKKALFHSKINILNISEVNKHTHGIYHQWTAHNASLCDCLLIDLISLPIWSACPLFLTDSAYKETEWMSRHLKTTTLWNRAMACLNGCGQTQCVAMELKADSRASHFQNIRDGVNQFSPIDCLFFFPCALTINLDKWLYS